jgi:hypothetical protein
MNARNGPIRQRSREVLVSSGRLRCAVEIRDQLVQRPQCFLDGAVLRNDETPRRVS